MPIEINLERRKGKRNLIKTKRNWENHLKQRGNK